MMVTYIAQNLRQLPRIYGMVHRDGPSNGSAYRRPVERDLLGGLLIIIETYTKIHIKVMYKIILSSVRLSTYLKVAQMGFIINRNKSIFS